MKYLGKRHNFPISRDHNLANRLRSRRKLNIAPTNRRAQSINGKNDKKKVRN